MTKISVVSTDVSTEQKIKDAAKKVFMQKGYKATLTRDIAAEAGINLALLNYYFRKKEMLFQVVAKDLLDEFLGGARMVFNDKTTSIQDKFLIQSERYGHMLTANPHLALFVLSELQINSEGFIKTHQLDNLMIDSYFYKQLNELHAQGKMNISPIQLLVNFLSLMLFPFAGKAILVGSLNLKEEEFQQMIEERKLLIVGWLKLMIES